MGIDPVGPEDFEAAEPDEADTVATDGADTDTEEAEATEPVAA
jgi:hypothetical protein